MWRLEGWLEMFALGTKSLKCEFAQICCDVFQLPSTALTGVVWLLTHLAPSAPSLCLCPYLSSFCCSLPSLFLWFHPYLTQSYFFHLPTPLPQKICNLVLLITAGGYLSVFRQAAFMAPPSEETPLISQRSCSLLFRGWCAARAAAPSGPWTPTVPVIFFWGPLS